MRSLPERLESLELAKELGAVPFRKNNQSDIKGVSFTFEQLDNFVTKLLNPRAVILDRSELSAKGWSEAIEAAMADEQKGKAMLSMNDIRPRGQRISGKKGRKG